MKIEIKPIVIAFFLIQNVGYSENKDTSQTAFKPSFLFYSLSNELNYIHAWNLLDTTLNSFHYHHYLESPMLSLGHFISPKHSLFFDFKPQNNSVDLLYEISSMLYKNIDVKYYKARIPLTEVFFENGSNGEQGIELLHTQNINKNWNIAGKLNLNGEQGSYARQNSSRTSLLIQTDYYPEKSAYGFNFNAIYNTIKLEENGGIYNDSLFILDTLIKKILIPVSLNNATNNLMTSYLNFFHYFNVGKRYLFNDNDSIFAYKFRVGHKFAIENNSLRFRDVLDTSITSSADSVFFKQFFPIDSLTEIYDSIHYSIITNKIFFTSFSGNMLNSVNNSKRFHFLAGITHELYNYHQASFDTVFDKVFGEIYFNWNFSNENKIAINAKHGIYGYARNDLFLNPSLYYKFKKSGTDVQLSYYIDKSYPSVDKIMFHSDWINWNNSFEDIYSTATSILINNQKRRMELFANYYSIKNLIYFNSKAFPEQENKTINVVKVGMRKSWSWSKWHLNTETVYQKSSDPTILSIPEIVTFNSFYFESPMIHNAIFSRIGIDVLYFTSYYADSWMPVIRHFYLQRSKEVGNYPYAGLLLAVQIKHARIFFRANHLYAGLLGNDYFAIPHYPMPGRTFQFGINWRFYD